MVAGLNFSDPVLKAFAFYTVIVVLKMMLMSFYTIFHRMTRKVFANAEDTVNPFSDGKSAKVSLTDPVVERARRGHQNDLENIPPFVLIGLLYVLTGPSLQAALWHFRLFAGARLVHTVVYMSGVQPWRAMTFALGFGVTVSMAWQVLCHTM